MNDRQMTELGKHLAEVLRLKGKRARTNVEFDTAWGGKTYQGLFLTIKRLVSEEYATEFLIGEYAQRKL